MLTRADRPTSFAKIP